MRVLFSSSTKGLPVVILYVCLSGALMRLNAAVLVGLEWPWNWYWLLWGLLFAPAAGTIAILGAVSGLSWTRHWVVAVGSLLSVLVTMEIAFLLDLELLGTAILSVSLCVAIFAGFSVANR